MDYHVITDVASVIALYTGLDKLRERNALLQEKTQYNETTSKTLKVI